MKRTKIFTTLGFFWGPVPRLVEIQDWKPNLIKQLVEDIHGLILDAKRRSQRFSRAFGHIQFIVFMSPVCSGAGIHQAEASSSRGATWDIYLSRLAIYLDAEYVYSFW
jgi:hypothetical protein